MTARGSRAALLAAAVAVVTMLAVAAPIVRPSPAAADRGGRTRVKPQPPADDQVVRFPARDPQNPGRVEFSHVRHFNALGDKQCQTCHSPEMKLIAGSPPEPTRGTGAVGPEPHAPTSRGRFCASCHDGRPRPASTARPSPEPAPVFTTARTANVASCQRCHAPADHGADFTRDHGEIAEHGRSQTCRACHRQDWSSQDRQRHADLLAAERVLKSTPDDPAAALVVGPNNFCVYCHRADTKWAR